MLQEEKYEKCCGSLLQILAGKGEKELNDALNVAVAKVSNIKKTDFGVSLGVFFFLRFFFILKTFNLVNYIIFLKKFFKKNPILDFFGRFLGLSFSCQPCISMQITSTS